MGLSEKQTTVEFDLDLPSDLPDSVASDIREEVGQYLVDAILDKVGGGESPVRGYGSFKKLSKAYAQNEKGGRTLPNLDLEGDMLNSLTFKASDLGVEVGIWDETQAAKSFGHNSGFAGHPVLDGVAPKRRFIPGEGERFRADIEKTALAIRDSFLQAYDNTDDDSEDDQGDDTRSTKKSAKESKRTVNQSADDRPTSEMLADLEDRGSAISAQFDSSAFSKTLADILGRRG